jgi:hypothetical protein
MNTLKKTGIGVALTLLTVTNLGLMWQNHGMQAETREAQCIYVTSDYDTDSGETVMVDRFSDLGPDDRALADLYDCDIEGR